MKNQEHNNNLDQLFNKAKADKQGLDDFEEDAFAGFESLGSEQEAKDLKAALDTRINKELFNKEEKNNSKIYWLAAAGLALVIGLTTLFVSNNTNTFSYSSDLAISNPEQKAEEKISTESKTELKEQALAPIETETNALDEAPAKEIILNNVAKENLKNEEPLKITKNLEEEEKKGVKSRMIVPAVKSEVAKDGYFFKDDEKDKKESDQLERRKENFATGTGNNNNYDNTLGGLDELSKTDKSKEKINTDYKYAATTTTTKADQNKKAETEDAEVNIKDAVAANEGKKGKADEKTKDTDLEQSSKQPLVLANTTTNNNTNSAGRESGKTKSRAKKSAQKQSAMAGPDDIAYSNTPKSTVTQQEMATEVNATPAEAENKPGNATLNCYYAGGETAITKDIKEKLKAENSDQKFDAILYIDEKKTVEKVEFTNTYDLTAKQKEDVIKILKSLNKFNVPASSGKKESFTYKLLYRP
ncbi:MAG: hypothetical protein H0W73_10375 [Bacteroidetes bacterium]|nr:hypothetical protein [Bacteroidota bacterium]